MKKLLVSLLVIASASFAFANEFDKESPEYDSKKQVKNDQATIHKKITEDMDVSCKGSLCTIAQKDTHNRGWSVTLNVGEGPAGYGYGYGYGNGGGSTVIVGDPSQNQNQQYYGVTVRYENMHCTSNTNIDKSMYEVLKTYILSMLTEDGATKRTFTPADQATILQYVTMISNTDGCRSSNNTGGR